MNRGLDRIEWLHALSGLSLSLFIALHLLNHAAAFGGPFAFASFRGFLRHFYQFPLYEIALLCLPLLFNLVTGVWMLLRHGPRDAAPPRLRRRLHRWSGVCLAALAVPHALSTRGAALLFGIDPDFHFVARTLAGPRGAAAGILYAALVMAASYHLPNGIFTFLDESGVLAGRLQRRFSAAALVFAGVALMVCGLAGLLSYAGVLYPGNLVETLQTSD